MNTDRKKYLIVLLITVGIFIVVFGLVALINNTRLANIDDLQRQITADLIATETQFDLLKTAPCRSIENTILSQELDEFGRKLDFAQDSQGSTDTDVIQLKKYYSLLQVKDYLLMEEFAGKCDIEINSILYFYGYDCDDCIQQGLVLTEFKKRYPEMRIYSFDTNLDFSVINTFASLYEFGDEYPALIINNETYQGLQGLDALEEIFPEVVENKLTQERSEDGIEYILDLDDYQDLSIKDISFGREINGTYEYFISATEGEEPDLLELLFDEETEDFFVNE
ncbi:MAG: hypothetical protein ACJAV6_000574 [Candidatus Paceibacteria bacterium]|jgi:hypothetical protein